MNTHTKKNGSKRTKRLYKDNTTGAYYLAYSKPQILETIGKNGYYGLKNISQVHNDDSIKKITDCTDIEVKIKTKIYDISNIGSIPISVSANKNTDCKNCITNVNGLSVCNNNKILKQAVKINSEYRILKNCCGIFYKEGN